MLLRAEAVGAAVLPGHREPLLLPAAPAREGRWEVVPCLTLVGSGVLGQSFWRAKFQSGNF